MLNISVNGAPESLFAMLEKYLKIRCLNRLHLPTEIVPATHKKAARPARPAGIRAGGEGAYRAPRPDREEYRKKDSAPSGEFRPQFAGVGRGAPRE